MCTEGQDFDVRENLCAGSWKIWNLLDSEYLVTIEKTLCCPSGLNFHTYSLALTVSDLRVCLGILCNDRYGKLLKVLSHFFNCEICKISGITLSVKNSYFKNSFFIECSEVVSCRFLIFSNV